MIIIFKTQKPYCFYLILLPFYLFLIKLQSMNFPYSIIKLNLLLWIFLPSFGSISLLSPIVLFYFQ